MGKLSAKVLRWYKAHGRMLPWREYPNPYAVWVSEIMLQQTRVDAVIPYFERWMARFPTIESVARADEQDVLNLWEGLGYYSRARNLHQAAKLVMKNFNGELPRAAYELRKLPGVGRYTAGAIASMAFGLHEPVLDGNIRRIYARIFNIDARADLPQGEKLLWSIAAENLPRGRAGDYNQALMDLGAIICLPKNPRCSACPLQGECDAQKRGVQESRPVLRAKTATPHYVQVAAVILRRGRVLMAKRPSRGLLGGMWEFPNARVTGNPVRGLVKAIRSATRLKVSAGEALTVIQHAYTHFRVTSQAFQCELIEMGDRKNLRWIRLTELEEYPMGKIDRQIARKLKD